MTASEGREQTSERHVHYRDDEVHFDPHAGCDFTPAEGREQTLSPEAVLTWDSVRRLELHTDIGPGNVGPLLIEVNFRQHQHTLALLRESGHLSATAREHT